MYVKYIEIQNGHRSQVISACTCIAVLICVWAENKNAPIQLNRYTQHIKSCRYTYVLENAYLYKHLAVCIL